MAKVHAVSSKLWQELSQSINELLLNENYLLQENLIMLTQLPFHKDKGYQQLNAHCVNSIYCWVCRVSRLSKAN